MSGAADGVPEGGVFAVPDHRHDGDGTMNTAMAMPGNTAATFLTHFFGGGLEDERYVVERFKAMADGDIRPWPADEPPTKKGRKARRVTATFRRADGRTLHVRKATRAKPPQQAIYDALGIDPAPGATRKTIV